MLYLLNRQKPENLGFDIRGRIKLFDFGLAVELRPEDMLEDGTYKLPKGGTLRYMSCLKNRNTSRIIIQQVSSSSWDWIWHTHTWVHWNRVCDGIGKIQDSFIELVFPPRSAGD